MPLGLLASGGPGNTLFAQLLVVDDADSIIYAEVESATWHLGTAEESIKASNAVLWFLGGQGSMFVRLRELCLFMSSRVFHCVGRTQYGWHFLLLLEGWRLVTVQALDISVAQRTASFPYAYKAWARLDFAVTLGCFHLVPHSPTVAQSHGLQASQLLWIWFLFYSFFQTRPCSFEHFPGWWILWISDNAVGFIWAFSQVSVNASVKGSKTVWFVWGSIILCKLSWRSGQGGGPSPHEEVHQAFYSLQLTGTISTICQGHFWSSSWYFYCVALQQAPAARHPAELP